MTARATYRPHAYQRAMIDHILDNPRCALWAGMGMGKTVAALTALDALSLVDPAPALVLAPLRVAAGTWPDEARKWSHLGGVEVVPIVGNAAARAAALRRPATVYTCNYDNLPWLVEQHGDAWPYHTVVADESTRLKSFRLRQGGARARALGRVAHTRVARMIELTGTPSPNGLPDLWGQAWFLDRGKRLGRSYTAYKDRWFRRIRVGIEDYAIKLEPYEHAQAEIEAALRDICLAMDARDYYDVAEPIVVDVRVDLPAKARQLYRAMEREMYLSLGDSEVEAVNAASRTIKCLQLANGTIYADERAKTWAEVHDAKLQALDSIVAEAAGMPILVVYHFRADLARLQRALPRGRVLDGDPETVRAWNRGDIPALFAHPASAGHGLNLQDGGNIIVMYGHWWDLEQYQQVIERIGPMRQRQAGHDRPVYIYRIIAADTLDELVVERLASKRGVQDLLLEAAKRRQY